MAQRGVNRVIIMGIVGKDPEVRYTPQGDAVCSLSIATSEVWKDKQTGQDQERTEWHRVSFWGRPAEIIGEHVRKGSKLYVEGKLQTRSWEQDGIKRYATEIRSDSFQFVGGKDTQGGSSGSGQKPAQRNTEAPAQDPNVPDSFDDDIPF